MKLDGHIQALIAVGAALAANCRPCLHSALAVARESGADEQEIAEALEVARRVRNGAVSKMDLFALGLLPAIFSAAHVSDSGCGCDSTISMMEGKNG